MKFLILTGSKATLNKSLAARASRHRAHASPVTCSALPKLGALRTQRFAEALASNSHSTAQTGNDQDAETFAGSLSGSGDEGAHAEQSDSRHAGVTAVKAQA
jgi:hypothetical protein